MAAILVVGVFFPSSSVGEGVDEKDVLWRDYLLAKICDKVFGYRGSFDGDSTRKTRIDGMEDISVFYSAMQQRRRQSGSMDTTQKRGRSLRSDDK